MNKKKERQLERKIDRKNERTKEGIFKEQKCRKNAKLN